jgi:hypothetical protein
MGEASTLRNRFAPAARLRDLLYQFSYFPKTLHLTWAAAPRLTLVWLFLLIVQGVLPAATVTLTKRMIDSLVAVVTLPPATLLVSEL